MNWEPKFNIAELPKGSFRSIMGYASESLVIGRAMQCGYNLFFKAWRDSPYDGVLDHNGILFRIEIKGTSTNKTLGLTSGSRSGAQINRNAETREHLIRQEDADFVIGVNNLNSDCFIIPTEILQIFSKKTLPFIKLNPFLEQWSIFKDHEFGDYTISSSMIKSGFRNFSEIELNSVLDNIRPNYASEIESERLQRFCRSNNLSAMNLKIYLIWETLCQPLST